MDNLKFYLMGVALVEEEKRERDKDGNVLCMEGVGAAASLRSPDLNLKSWTRLKENNSATCSSH